jgi:hypothetical protein
LKEHVRAEEELRVYSIKYVNLLNKYNKVTENLALLSNSEIPEIIIPEEIYDKQLEQR